MRLNNVDGVLEPAVMAMGVPRSEVYQFLSSEIGIEKAIDKVREQRTCCILEVRGNASPT